MAQIKCTRSDILLCGTGMLVSPTLTLKHEMRSKKIQINQHPLNHDQIFRCEHVAQLYTIFRPSLAEEATKQQTLEPQPFLASETLAPL